MVDGRRQMVSGRRRPGLGERSAKGSGSRRVDGGILSGRRRPDMHGGRTSVNGVGPTSAWARGKVGKRIGVTSGRRGDIVGPTSARHAWRADVGKRCRADVGLGSGKGRQKDRGHVGSTRGYCRADVGPTCMAGGRRQTVSGRRRPGLGERSAKGSGSRRVDGGILSGRRRPDMRVGPTSASNIGPTSARDRLDLGWISEYADIHDVQPTSGRCRAESGTTACRVSGRRRPDVGMFTGLSGRALAVLGPCSNRALAVLGPCSDSTWDVLWPFC